MATEATRSRNTGRFEMTLGTLFDEKTAKILDDLIRESRKEIFESNSISKPDSAIPE
jgi:hypothetical protein